MAEFPALPLFTDAYLADTRHLTAEEHGAYLLLLMCAWRTRGCALKDCDRTLARIVGVTRPRWRRLRPVMAEFFTIADGLWRQKKLDDVYRGVEARVAKNRQNGAKGGRAKAAILASSLPASPKPPGGGGGETLPTKTRLQKPKPKAKAAARTNAGAPAEAEIEVDLEAEVGVGVEVEVEAIAQDPNTALAQIAAAAGLKENKDFLPLFCEWQAAGAGLETDILPTIGRLRAREVARSGAAPKVLAYYSAAVLEARDSRLGAKAAGQAHAENHPPAVAKRVFDMSSAADWRLFLGDASSRFRGEYLSQNWAIGRNHPVFQAADLGPDPRFGINKRIPAEIFAAYAGPWRWLKC